MLADTSIQPKKNVTMETSTLNKSCVHIMSRDSCVGLYETVNEGKEPIESVTTVL